MLNMRLLRQTAGTARPIHKFVRLRGTCSMGELRGLTRFRAQPDRIAATILAAIDANRNRALIYNSNDSETTRLLERFGFEPVYRYRGMSDVTVLIGTTSKSRTPPLDNRQKTAMRVLKAKVTKLDRIIQRASASLAASQRI